MPYNHKMNSPFILENETEYKEWRNYKLSLFPVDKDNLTVKFNDKDINTKKIKLLKDIINKYNFAIYEFESKLTNKSLREFCSKLKLKTSIKSLVLILCELFTFFLLTLIIPLRRFFSINP